MEIKDRILEAAISLFLRNGIKSVSMDDIAQHLSVSKKTIYKWFDNKDQIVQACIKNHLYLTQQNCNHRISHAENAIDETLQIMEMNKEVFSNIHPSIFYDMQKYHPAAWQLFLEHKNCFILEKISENIRRGIREGLFRKDLDVEILSRLRLALIDLAFNPDVFPAQQFDIGRVQLTCIEHFMMGIATLKGHKLINKYKQITEEE